MNYYTENLDIISRKFPFLYMLLISKIETKKKKLVSWPEKFEIKKDTDILFIYKFFVKEEALEDIKKWLTDKHKKLYFFDSDLDYMRSFFATLTANELLKHDNVSFHFFIQLRQLLMQITVFLNSRKVQVDTFVRKTKYYNELKKEIIQYSLLSFFSVHDIVYSHKIFKNFYSNIDKIGSSFLVNGFKNEFKNKPAVILGAGPSLGYSFEILHRLQNKALLIAGGSAITCLSKMYVLPHLGIIIDPNFDEYERMKKSLSFEMPMIFSTRVNLGVFNTFNGQTGYIKNAIGGLFEAWLDRHLKIPGNYLCLNYTEKALTVASVSILLAKFLGCNPIILDGMDLGFSQDKRYSADIIEDNKLDDEKLKSSRMHLAKDKNNKDIYTSLSWEIERDWISNFAEKNKETTFLNATKEGLKIDNVEDMPLLEIEKKFLKDQFDYKSYLFYLSQKNKIFPDKKKDFSITKQILRKSFERTKNYLQDIIDNKLEYKVILAKEEFLKETAYKYFLAEYHLVLKDSVLKKQMPESESFVKLLESLNFFLNECI